MFCISGSLSLFSLLRELGSTSDLENSIKRIVYCSVQVDDGVRELIVLTYVNLSLWIQIKVLKEASLLPFRGRRRIQVSKRQFYGTFNLYNLDI